MSPKHYFKRYLFRICFVINALSDNFYVSRKLVAVPINFVTQLLLKECKVTLLHLWYNAACLWLACPLLPILLPFSSTFSLPHPPPPPPPSRLQECRKIYVQSTM